MFFALTADQEAALIATRDDAEVHTFLEDLDMGDWDGEPLYCGTDKAWDAMHRCLSDGTLGSGRRLSPLDLTVLGGGHHYEGDEDFKYTWYWFTQVRDFYRKAAAVGRAVIFTVDQ